MYQRVLLEYPSRRWPRKHERNQSGSSEGIYLAAKKFSDGTSENFTAIGRSRKWSFASAFELQFPAFIVLVDDFTEIPAKISVGTGSIESAFVGYLHGGT